MLPHVAVASLIASPVKAPMIKLSIAVLPFQNMSGDPEQEYFADGMVAEIITALSRIRWLFVIARNLNADSSSSEKRVNPRYTFFFARRKFRLGVRERGVRFVRMAEVARGRQ